jgi:lipopolysaccharide transport system ATP-binding protein
MRKGDAAITLQNVSVEFPIFNSSNLFLTNKILRTATGGIISQYDEGIVLVKSLQDISLSIRAGDRVGLIGHNGSGKTTLLRVLAGIYFPTGGKISIQGECTSLININLGIDSEATGRENIRMRASLMGLTPQEIRQKADEIIEFSGLGKFIDLPFRTYSSGMQLRLAFAVSTAISPEILIMDEWLSTGDEDFKERAEQRLRALVQSTDILILASHSRQLIRSNCNRVVWLEHGRIKMDGTPQEVLPHYFGEY